MDDLDAELDAAEARLAEARELRGAVALYTRLVAAYAGRRGRGDRPGAWVGRAAAGHAEVPAAAAPRSPPDACRRAGAGGAG
jgi:hypothetical protein